MGKGNNNLFAIHVYVQVASHHTHKVLTFFAYTLLPDALHMCRHCSKPQSHITGSLCWMNGDMTLQMLDLHKFLCKGYIYAYHVKI